MTVEILEEPMEVLQRTLSGASCLGNHSLCVALSPSEVTVRSLVLWTLVLA